MTIVIDFDNTIFKEDWPNIGELIPDAKEVINKWYAAGDTIIINTCREGAYKNDAIQALNDNQINFHLFNENDPRLTAKYGWDSRKIGADIYIEDRTPQHLVHGVNWIGLEALVEVIKYQREHGKE